MEQNNSLYTFFTRLERTLSPKSPLRQAVQGFCSAQRELLCAPSDAPFLTVLTRTQGKRPEALSELLASLAAQTNQSFEWVLLPHNAEEHHDALARMLAAAPAALRERTRICPVSGGTRTTPLNVGFAEARGTYIAVLDDDDTVTPQWADAFWRASQTNGGKVLHAFTLCQDWELYESGGARRTRAVGEYDRTYCRPFDILLQLRLNVCPLGALAFPAFLFTHLGQRFDETLTTTEDWDYLMRAALLLGVADIAEETFLYRRWVGEENATSLHAKAEWEQNYRRILAKLSDVPALIGVTDVEAHLMLPIYDAPAQEETILFWDDGTGFCAERTWVRDHTFSARGYTHAYRPTADAVPVHAFRFDPCDYGGFTAAPICVRVILADGTVLPIDARTVQTNGYVTESGHTVFLQNDPQFWFVLPTPARVSEVQLYFSSVPKIETEDMEQVLSALTDARLNERLAARKHRLFRKKQK